MSEPDSSTTDAPETAPEGGDGGGKQYTPPQTQADLDRIIADRVARTKAQFKDYGDLKAKADRLAQLEAANQTDLERAQSELTRWQTEAETWRGAAVKSRIETLAADFADPDDALAAIGDPAQFIDAGGQINNEAIQAELASVLERKPHWRKQPDSPSGPRQPTPNPAQGTSGTSAHASPRDQFAAILQQPR